MAEPLPNPAGYGRRPTDGPGVSRSELERRQAGKVNATDNGELDNGVTKPYLTPAKSAT